MPFQGVKLRDQLKLMFRNVNLMKPTILRNNTKITDCVRNIQLQFDPKHQKSNLNVPNSQSKFQTLN